MDESWVVEDESDSGISWDDRSEKSAEHHDVARHSPKMTRIPQERRSSRRSTPVRSEPQFIMPTLPASIPSTDQPRLRRPAAQNRALRLTQTPTAKDRQHQKTATSPVVDKSVHVLVHTAEWLLDILGQTLKALKKPLSWLLAAYLFAGILMLMQNLLTNSIYAALSPICRIPGMSLLDLPMCHYSSANPNAPRISDGASAPVEFDALMKTQSQFEDILSESATGVSLPLDMKRSESSIRDLRQIVRHSQLASRNEMVLEFDGFIETARIASYDLQKFNSHIGRGVDIVLSTARWTERVLEDMAHKRSNRGLIPSLVQDKILAPFKPLQFTESMLLDQYITHTRVVSDEIERLIEEAQALLQVLQNLDDRLEVIHTIAARDDVAAQANRDEILSHLWTSLGGNRAKLGRVDRQLNLLGQVGQYRKIAFAHVAATILKLQAMGAELEGLRERVSSAEVLRDHMEIPLAVHVANIKLGVERLEAGRESARSAEKGHVRNILDGAEQSNLLVAGEA
jgi:hypothetical protein